MTNTKEAESVGSGDLVPIGYAYGPMEAALASSLLEDAGMLVHVQAREMACNAWHYMTALGGMAILVPEEQASEADALLADFQPTRTHWSPEKVIFLVLMAVSFGWVSAGFLPASGFFRLHRTDQVEGPA